MVNAIGARERGAHIRPRTPLVAARRDNGLWRVTTQNTRGEQTELRARALVNAAGPWVKRVHDEVGAARGQESVRHSKGSHIVVPQVHSEKHAYILQNADKRIVFIIPYEERYSLIGTTDIAVDEYEHPQITHEEIDCLCGIANAYLAQPIVAADFVWTYGGCGRFTTTARSLGRDARLSSTDAAGGRAPLLSIFGSKITAISATYRGSAGAISEVFPQMEPAWTPGEPLPGGDIPRRDRPRTGASSPRVIGATARYRDALLHRHGTRAPRVS